MAKQPARFVSQVGVESHRRNISASSATATSARLHSATGTPSGTGAIFGMNLSTLSTVRPAVLRELPSDTRFSLAAEATKRTKNSKITIGRIRLIDLVRSEKMPLTS